MKIDKEDIKFRDYKRFSLLMDQIRVFSHENQFLSFIEFDNFVSHELTLFSIDHDFDFDNLEQVIQHIKKALPSIKRIFNKPIIILKDTDDVLPVENTRIINQKTFLHLANHAHHVANITHKGVKPRKLLTRLYEDDYGIYENIVFCNLVDMIVSLLRRYRRTLENLIYASDIMKFNLLEKVNHMNFFLALGKLHTGYIRDFNQYFTLSKKLLHEINHIVETIKSRLHKAVYKKNNKRQKILTLKKTNIFLKQKDYRQVFKTYKYLLGNKLMVEDSQEQGELDILKSNYILYVKMLMLFAIKHFNFKVDSSIKMDLINLNVTFDYKSWSLNVYNKENQDIVLTFNKDKKYQILISNSDKEDDYQYQDNPDIDEIINVSPIIKDYLEREDVFLSMDDIDSFRRLQQILLKGMIYSDEKRETCPFCGGKMIHHPRLDFYECQSCMLQIKEKVCEENNQRFYYTENAHQNKITYKKINLDHDEDWYHDKHIESLMHFRNITKINEKGEILCPDCHHVHN
ncbi:MAG: hypothetical protein AB7E09_07310 [Candidatus Izemoplasmatales bacterium]